jgi:ribosomal protein S18 acetylase RimI-like enzyme
MSSRQDLLKREPALQIAGVEDAEEILALQKLCFQSEAALNNNDNIPPLTQALVELLHEFVTCCVLKIVLDGQIIGSVRARAVEGTCYIGRLIVHPKFKGRGLGTRLMSRIELEFGYADRFEIFTGSRSLDNLRLYERLGYREVRRQTISDSLDLVYMQKEPEKAT